MRCQACEAALEEIVGDCPVCKTAVEPKTDQAEALALDPTGLTDLVREIETQKMTGPSTFWTRVGATLGFALVPVLTLLLSVGIAVSLLLPGSISPILGG